MKAYLEFEKQIADLEGQIRELQKMGESDDVVDVDDDVARLRTKSEQALSKT
jgi:acetyl-CoA carboxylase carboxyl transferase subunit alpha